MPKVFVWRALPSLQNYGYGDGLMVAFAATKDAAIEAALTAFCNSEYHRRLMLNVRDRPFAEDRRLQFYGELTMTDCEELSEGQAVWAMGTA